GPMKGGRPGTPDWIPLGPFLANLAAEQQVSAREKSLVLLTQLDAANGWEANLDKVRLGRLLSNLLVNAIRYTARGRVRFSAAWQVAANGAGGAGRTLVLAVEDTGAGISAEEQESIFHPFERGRAGKEADSGGSGLGLAVVDRLVEELGLSLEVYSEFGHGSAFHLTLPADRLRPIEEAGEEGSAPGERRPPGLTPGALVSGERFGDDRALGQQGHGPVGAVGQRRLGVDAQQVVGRRQHVLRRDRPLHHGAAYLVRPAHHLPAGHAAAGQDGAVGLRPVVAAAAVDVLHLRRPAVLAQHQHQRLIEPAALVEVGDQAGEPLVEAGQQLVLHARVVVPVRVPAR